MKNMSQGQHILSKVIDKVDILLFQNLHNKKQDMMFSNDFTNNKLLVMH